MKIKKALWSLDDTRSTLVDWVPFFDSDYRYTVNLKAYLAISWVIGIGMILLGAVIFLNTEFPYISWREASVTSKSPTNSLCMIRTEDSSNNEPTYRYSYTVDDKSYQSKKAYCNEINNTTSILYNPADPAESIPVNNSGLRSSSILITSLGIGFIALGYLSTILINRYYGWLEKDRTHQA
ncbi:MAG: hypothetical protein WAW80_00215 [Candidatus Saccharimonadales bacterium]